MIITILWTIHQLFGQTAAATAGAGAGAGAGGYNGTSLITIAITEQLVEKMAARMTAKAGSDLKNLPLDETVQNGRFTYSFWDLKFEKFEVNPPKIDFSESDDGSLVVNAKITGDLFISSGWKVTYKRRFSISKSGYVDIQMSGFAIDTRAVVRTAEEGGVNVEHDASQCQVDVGDMNIKFSASGGWLMNMVTDFFSDHIETKVQKMICQVIDAKFEGGLLRMKEDSAVQRKSQMKLFEDRLLLDTGLAFIRGSDGCAAIGIKCVIDVEKLPTQEPTTPFLTKPYTRPLTEEREGGSKQSDSSRSGSSTTSATTSSGSTTTTPHSTTTAPREAAQRERRQAGDGGPEGRLEGGPEGRLECPGTGHNLQIRLNEQVIENIAEALHELRIIKLRSVQVGFDNGTATFHHYWGERDLGERRAKEKSNKLLSAHNMETRVFSSGYPVVHVQSEGINITSLLTSRVILTPRDKASFVKEARLEIPMVAYFMIKLELVLKNGKYRLKPAVAIKVHVQDVRRNIKFSSALIKLFAKGKVEAVLGELEEKMGALIQKKMSTMVTRMFSAGFPLNIPSSLHVEDVQILYHQDHVQINANVQRITL